MDIKSIFKSKTFWLNIIAAAATYFGQLPVTQFTIYALLAANIVMRIITTGPVAVLSDVTGTTPPAAK